MCFYSQASAYKIRDGGRMPIYNIKNTPRPTEYIKCRELRQETSVLNAHLFSVEYKRRCPSGLSAHKHKFPTVPERNTRLNSGTVTYITISIRGLQYSEVPATVTTALRNQYLLSGTSPSSSAEAFVVISAVVHSLAVSGTSPL